LGWKKKGISMFFMMLEVYCHSEQSEESPKITLGSSQANISARCLGETRMVFALCWFLAAQWIHLTGIKFQL
jgi:hypothetical protein